MNKSASEPEEADNDTSMTPQSRSPQWIYLVPIVLAPVAHMVVSASRRMDRSKRGMMLGLTVALTVGAVLNRVVLMKHAGFPGAEGEKAEDRFVIDDRHGDRRSVDE